MLLYLVEVLLDVETQAEVRERVDRDLALLVRRDFAQTIRAELRRAFLKTKV